MCKGHIDLFLRRRSNDIYGESILLDATFAHSKTPVKFKDLNLSDFVPITEGEKWAEKWESAWFHLKGKVPASWKGKTAALLLNLSGEILLASANGTPICGLTAGSVFNSSFVKERYEIGEVSGNEDIEFYAEAAANHIMGVNLPFEVALDTPHPEGYLNAVVKTIRLVEFRKDIWKFFTDVKIIFDALSALPEKDYRANIMFTALYKAVCIYQDNPNNVAKAQAELEDILALPATASSLNVYAIGHAHIDVGWLWPVRESIRKAARTFSSQLRLMEKYPNYIFGASQPQLYMFIKEHYPEIYQEIKERVKEGRWELQGGMWVEADCNLISGESMIRQFVHGKNFFMDEFGIEVKNLWLPDVFGYSAAMPQIIRKSGCDYFLTQKLSWSRINEFPHETFIWEGIDGSKVLSHFPPEKTYNSSLTPARLNRAQNEFKENGFLNKFVSLFGIGDGGGGPNEQHLENLARVQNWEFTPKVTCKKAEDFFNDLAFDQDKLDTFTGELYLEFHRGTFTTQARTKRANRQNEQLLSSAEYLASHLDLDLYPQKEFDTYWKKLLCNQFHDIIPGSSIGMVYEDAAIDYQEIKQGCEKIISMAGEQLFEKAENYITIVNTLSENTSQTVLLPSSWSGYEVKLDGTTLPVQDLPSGEVAVSLNLAGNSFTNLTKGNLKEKSLPIPCDNLVLENTLVRFTFEKSGKLLSAFDKETNQEMLASPGNILSIYYDHANCYEAWDVEIFYQDELNSILEANSYSSFKGEVYDYIEFTYNFGDSSLKQTIKLEKNSKRLDFDNYAQWFETRKMLRTSFETTINSTEATFDIQYGNVKRSTTNNTSWELAQYEVCAHKYADLSNSRCGVALINDCKYGYKVKSSTLDLALLRSPKHPDFSADRGEHFFTYSLYLHKGEAMDSNLLSEAAALNRKPLVFEGVKNVNTKPICQLTGDGLSLAVVKKAEKSSCLVIRVVETKGHYSSGSIQFNNPVEVIPTNLIEWEDKNSITLPTGKLDLELSPFEIRTYKVIFK